QLLELVFYLVLGSERVKLEKVFLPAANWIDESELRWEQSAAVLDLPPHRRTQPTKQGRKPKRRRSIWEEPDEPEVIPTTKTLNRSAVLSSNRYLSTSHPSPRVDTLAHTNASRPQLTTITDGSSSTIQSFTQPPLEPSLEVLTESVGVGLEENSKVDNGIELPEPNSAEKLNANTSLPAPPVVLRRKARPSGRSDRISISSICGRSGDTAGPEPRLQQTDGTPSIDIDRQGRTFSLGPNGGTTTPDVHEPDMERARIFLQGLSGLSQQFTPADSWKLKTKLLSIQMASNQFRSYLKQNHAPEVLQKFYHLLPEDRSLRDELCKVIEQLSCLGKDSTKKPNESTIEVDNESAGVLGHHSLPFQTSPDLVVHLAEAVPTKRKPKCVNCQELGHTFINCTQKSRWSVQTRSKR
ncbi:hypothetical protein BDV33DRAFT_210935, partial [Aspergillus novoparasiticus]